MRPATSPWPRSPGRWVSGVAPSTGRCSRRPDRNPGDGYRDSSSAESSAPGHRRPRTYPLDLSSGLLEIYGGFPAYSGVPLVVLERPVTLSPPDRLATVTGRSAATSAPSPSWPATPGWKPCGSTVSPPTPTNSTLCGTCPTTARSQRDGLRQRSPGAVRATEVTHPRRTTTTPQRLNSSSAAALPAHSRGTSTPCRAPGPRMLPSLERYARPGPRSSHAPGRAAPPARTLSVLPLARPRYLAVIRTVVFALDDTTTPCTGSPACSLSLARRAMPLVRAGSP